MTTWDMDAPVSRSADQVSTVIDGETVLLSVEAGKYFAMTEVGTRIWELLEQPRSPSTILETLLAEFDVDEETCRTDLLAFLGQLDEQGLLHRGEEESSR